MTSGIPRFQQISPNFKVIFSESSVAITIVNCEKISELFSINTLGSLISFILN